MGEAVFEHFVGAVKAARAVAIDGEVAVGAFMQRLAAIANADAAVVALEVDVDPGQNEFVATHGLRPASARTDVLDLLHALPLRPVGGVASGRRRLVARPRGRWTARLHDIFDFDTEASVEWIPTDPRSQATRGAWILARGAQAPMEESRVSITSALTDLLTAELELSEISNDKRQDEPRAPGSTPVDGRADAAQTDFVTGDLDALLDALDVAVLLVANDRTIVLVNKEAELLFELPAAQLVGTRVNPGRFTASLAGRTLKLADGGLIRMAVSTGRQTPQVKLIMHRPDGTQIDLRVWARPVFRRIQDSRIGVAVFLKRFTQLESERGTRARLAALEMAFARLAPLIGGDPTIMQVAPSDLAQLTDRERQVLTLLAAGLRVANVAEELYVSEHTVRNHLKGIFRKLGVSNQAELIRRLRTTGHEFPEDGES